jgi:hypothetical protein
MVKRITSGAATKLASFLEKATPHTTPPRVRLTDSNKFAAITTNK